MQGREFLELAREILPGGAERHWRGAAGRAYYALFLEGRDALDRWGFRPAPHTSVHHFVRDRFSIPAEADLKTIGFTVDRLSQVRNRADYVLSALSAFRSSSVTAAAAQGAADCIDLLDAIETDPTRLAAAIAAITAAFP